MQIYRFVLGALFAVGCSGGAIEVGAGDGGAANTGGSPGGAGSSTADTNLRGTLPANDCSDTTPLPVWPSATDCVASTQLPLAGSWQGYAENASAPWDRLSLVINGASVDGGVCGTLTIGSGSTPEPTSDPNAGYPPGANSIIVPGMVRSFPGFDHTLVHATTDGTRLRFSVLLAEPYRSWCALQTSSFNNGSHDCSCLPNWPMTSGSSPALCQMKDPSTLHDFEINCNKYSLCSGVCRCNASGCDVAIDRSQRIDFDLLFTGDSAEGSSTQNGGLRTRFTRMH